MPTMRNGKYNISSDIPRVFFQISLSLLKVLINKPSQNNSDANCNSEGNHDYWKALFASPIDLANRGLQEIPKAITSTQILDPSISTYATQLSKPQATDLELFRKMIGKGVPFMYQEMMEEADLQQWTPQGLKKNFGKIRVEAKCLRVRETPNKRPLQISSNIFMNTYFRKLNNSFQEELTSIVDWTSKFDIKTQFSSLWKNLVDNLPAQQHTEPNGIFNLNSYVPIIASPFVGGPKFHTTMGSTHGNVTPTTPLHINTCDELNTILYVGTDAFEDIYTGN